MAKNRQQNESNLFPESKLSAPTPEQAARISALSKVKDSFSNSVVEFRSLLKDPTLTSNRTQPQKDRQNQNLQDLNSHAGQLEKYNSGEGLFSLIFLALNSIFSIRDELNDVKFQNMMLHKKIKVLEEANSKSK